MTIPTAPKPAHNSNAGCVAIGVLVAALVLVSKCASSPTDSSSVETPPAPINLARDAIENVVAQQPTPPEVAELSLKSVNLGLERARLASADGLAGEMIYSQNCYDVIGRVFSWRKLDECGGFDVEASLLLDEGGSSGTPVEQAWFDPEAAAGRYLKAAIAAGESEADADSRFTALQARVARRHKPAASPVGDRLKGIEDFDAAAEDSLPPLSNQIDTTIKDG